MKVIHNPWYIDWKRNWKHTMCWWQKKFLLQCSTRLLSVANKKKSCANVGCRALILYIRYLAFDLSRLPFSTLDSRFLILKELGFLLGLNSFWPRSLVSSAQSWHHARSQPWHCERFPRSPQSIQEFVSPAQATRFVLSPSLFWSASSLHKSFKDRPSANKILPYLKHPHHP